jgi:hypothetical protein
MKHQQLINGQPLTNVNVGPCIIFVHSLSGWSEAEREHLGQELSDVLIYLVRLSEQCHIDLPAAVLDKFKLNAKKYPPGDAGLKYSTVEDKGNGV